MGAGRLRGRRPRLRRGLFNTISGTRTEKLAALDATTGVVDPVFAPATQPHIIAMDVSGGSVYVGTGDPLEGQTLGS